MKAKRYNPLIILFDLWSFVKNSFILIIYLFIIKAGSQSTLIKYGRLAFFVFAVGSIVYIFLSWVTAKYELDDDSFHLYKGLFSKTEQTIPFSKIQNVNKQTTLFHKILKVTSLQFETGIAGDDSTVTFEVISQKEADAIKNHIAEVSQKMITEDESLNDNQEAEVATERVQFTQENRTVHFTPTKQELIKASFTSFSFLMLIPFIGTIYFKIDEIYKIEVATETIISQIFSSAKTVIFLIVIFVIASIIFGISRTFLKYGKYEISSDDERIYIRKGILNEVDFSIEKNKVQAIQLNQSIIKRMLRLVEVEIISAGNLEMEDNSLEVSVLYPFLSIERAHHLINEILPTYEITQSMERLPKKSLIVKLIRQSFFWLLVTCSLLFLRDNFGSFEQFWWTVPLALFVISVIFMLLDYINTRYILNGEFVQFKKGSFSTTLFLTKRNKIFEVGATQSIVQRAFGLASIETINRAKPVHFDGVKDVPFGLAERFLQWYCGRLDEIEIDNS